MIMEDKFMGNINRPKLNAEDIELMRKIGEHNFVDMIYIYKFYKTDCKKRTVNERITQLAKHRYLSIIETFIPPEYTVKKMKGYKIVSLGAKGVEIMKDLGAEVETNLKALKNASSYRMYHQCQVAMVCDMMEYEFKNSGSKFEVAEIYNEKEAFIKDTGNMPDAVILFRPKAEYMTYSKERYIILFVEVERSYSSLKRFRSKVRAYENAIAEGTYIKHFDISAMAQRVLFVAQTGGQFKTILDKINEAGYDDIDILVSKYSQTCNAPADRIYTNPKNGEKYKLLSNLEV